jgi:hypothetical protein
MRKPVPLLLAMSLLLGACSGSAALNPPDKKRDGTSPVASKQTEEPPIVDRACQALMADFLNALTDLNSQVSGGLAFEEYIQQVGNIRVTYERIHTASVDPACTSAVALPAERALNRYVEAVNIWNNCRGDGGCTDDHVKPQLQAKWIEAASHIDAAETGLDTLPKD